MRRAVLLTLLTAATQNFALQTGRHLVTNVRQSNGLPSDYTYSYSEAPQPPPPEPPPPPPPLPPPPPASITLCSNTCSKAPKFASDSFCDDGGTDASFDNCDLGTDCSDCGPRVRIAHVPAAPRPPPASTSPPPPRVASPYDSEGVNPFEAKGGFYVSRERHWQLVRALNGTHAGTDDAAITGLLSAWNAPVGIWVDGKTRIRGASKAAAGSSTASRAPSATIEDVLRAAAALPAPQPLVVIVLHALPNRQCNSAAPSSEICCHYAASGLGASSIVGTCDYARGAQGGDAPDCDVGLAEYKADVVDVLATLLAEYEQRVPVALVIEPGSFSSLALGSSAHACTSTATRQSYIDGVAYAIDALSDRAPSAALYLDAGDGSQLGWGERVRSYVTQVARLGSLARRLRGFATNVGGYQPLGLACPAEHAGSLPSFCRAHPHEPCCATDPCSLLARYNSGVGELNYVQLLAKHMHIAMPDLKPRFLVDTGRSGVEHSRVDCESACNLRRAGFGALPTPHTALPAVVDAYFWVHPPGVSDGCSVSERGHSVNCARSMRACAVDDALGARPNDEAAPAAGELFVALLRRLAAQADGDAAYVGSKGDALAAGAWKRSPALTHVASQAVAFANQVGVPAAWAVGVVDATSQSTISKSDTSRSSSPMSMLLLFVVVATVGIVAFRRFVGRQGRGFATLLGRGLVRDADVARNSRTHEAIGLVEPKDDAEDEEADNVQAERPLPARKAVQEEVAVQISNAADAHATAILSAGGAECDGKPPVTEFRCVD